MFCTSLSSRTASSRTPGKRAGSNTSRNQVANARRRFCCSGASSHWIRFSTIRRRSSGPRLVSSPNVSDTEKLAWLVLGKPTLSGGSEDADVLFTAASVLLSDADAVPVQQQIANAVGLDEISVSSRTTSSTTGSTGGFSYRGGESDSVTTQVVTLGKRLSDKLYLSYEQGLADATQTVKLTNQLSRRWSAVARAGDDNALDFYYTLFFDTPRGGKAP